MAKVAPPSVSPTPKKEKLETKKGMPMSNLINESDKINVSLNNCSGTEERFPIAEQRLANQNIFDGSLSVFVEPPVGFDEEAEASYKVWQESLTYLEENAQKLP
jgi:hypothetical protein